MSRIVDWSLANRSVVLLGALALAVSGGVSLSRHSMDAIPDMSDVQVVVLTEYPGQAPRIVEDQVTYPLTTQLLSVPGARDVRGYSFFGRSLVYVVFEDGVDLYWARSRVLELLSTAAAGLPPGLSPALGPDATGVGWAFMYGLKSDRHDLGELRSLQDWFLKYELGSVPGVAEVASVGGFVRQYQITMDPNRLRAYDVTPQRIADAVRRSNADAGGRLLEIAGKEFMIRGRGYLRGPEEIGKIVLGVNPNGTPLLLENVARVGVGPDIRRGVAEWDGEGEIVGGIVVVRFGADTRQVVQAVKARLQELEPQLPEGVEVVVGYDRTHLIDDAVGNLRNALLQQFLIIGVVCLAFLLHAGSGLVAVASLPAGFFVACIFTNWIGVQLNIMSLGGVAVAIGTMVDAAIVMVENAHRHLARKRDGQTHWEVVGAACREVGPALFASLLVITVSFLPVFMLDEQQGRLFRPLAITKTTSMAAAALLSVTLVPVLVGCFVRGRIRSERRNPARRLLARLYLPVLRRALRSPLLALGVMAALLSAAAAAYDRLGSELMPPLWEGDLLYMPTTLPGISVTEARDLLQRTDRIIKTFPEVDHVFGKVGRAETATDPAPLSMIETTIQLKPRDQWREGMTRERLVAELERAVQVPGLTNAWTMPIKTRIDMLSTGIKTPVGVKLAGPDLAVLERLGQEVERTVRDLPGTSSVYAERVMGGNYLDIAIDRDAIARYGLTVEDVQWTIGTAIGGMQVTTTVEGLQRYPVNLRYERDFRDDLQALQGVLVPTPTGVQVPLAQLAAMEFVVGPPVIKSENARPNAWVYIDIDTSDLGGYVEAAREAVEADVVVPPGYSIAWSGQYESMQRAERRLRFVVPLTVMVIFVVISFSTKSFAKTGAILLGVPFALSGSFLLLHLLDYNLSVAVWVGLIAVAGLYAETAIVFMLYLDIAYSEAVAEGGMNDRRDLMQAICNGAVNRVRPIVMTVATDVIGLAPIMLSTGAGADMMKRIATPLFGGVATSALVVLVVFPTLFFLYRGRSLPGGLADLRQS